MSNQTIGTIKVAQVLENPDGSATVTFDVSNEVKNNLKKALNWKRWSQKRFETFVLKALTDYAAQLEEKHGIRQS